MTTQTASNTSPIRVAILADIDESGQVRICNRWAEPFEQVGISVECIPVGSREGESILAHVHGLLLPGGDSNIHPSLYNSGTIDEENTSSNPDIMRDLSAIKLLREAYERDLPTIGICRGMQEMIVAFGGDLQDLEANEYDHAEGYKNAPPDENGRRDPEKLDKLIHPFEVQKGGILDTLFSEPSFMVNSIHYQGITEPQWQIPENKALRDRFFIEALAPDGVVEAISAKNKNFFLGLQPHFELKGPLHDTVFQAFFRNINTYAQMYG